VLFDEVHERSLDSDFGLALALDAQAALRADLRWVKTVIRIELESERGCLTYDGLQTVWAFRQQLRLSGLTRGERIRLARNL
jgi:hypothetical protein